MRWPSDDGWPFDMEATYPVYFCSETNLPLSPFNQALRGGIAFGLELLYPRIPWVSISIDSKAGVVETTGRMHKKHQTKLLQRLRQWGRLNAPGES